MTPDSTLTSKVLIYDLTLALKSKIRDLTRPSKLIIRAMITIKTNDSKLRFGSSKTSKLTIRDLEVYDS